MKRFRFLAFCFALSAAFAVSAAAQGTVPAATTAGSGKIGLVNINMFADDKAGITKFRNALSAFNLEFKPTIDELTTMETKRQTLAKEIQTLQQQQAAASSAVPFKPESLNAKIEEYQTLELAMKRKQEDLKGRQEKRYPAVVGPAFNDILKALNDYAKQKGYAVILDGARLEQAEILLGFDDKYDVTKDFIAFYNARPAGTATTATPK